MVLTILLSKLVILLIVLCRSTAFLPKRTFRPKLRLLDASLDISNVVDNSISTYPGPSRYICCRKCASYYCVDNVSYVPGKDIMKCVVCNAQWIQVGPSRTIDGFHSTMQRLSEEKLIEYQQFAAEGGIGRVRYEKFTVYVANIPYHFLNRELFELFSEYGVVSGTVVLDRDTGRSRGFGFVDFSTREDAERAREMNGFFVSPGRQLLVQEYVPNST